LGSVAAPMFITFFGVISDGAIREVEAIRMLPPLILTFMLISLLFILSNKGGKSILHLRFKYDKFTIGACVLSFIITLIIAIRLTVNVFMPGVIYLHSFGDVLLTAIIISLIALAVNEVLKFILYKFYYSKRGMAKAENKGL